MHADQEAKLGDPLDDVGFTIYKVKDVNFSTNDGLAAAGKLKVSDFVNPNGSLKDTDKVTLAFDGEKTTDSQGQIVLNVGTAHGVYLVIETSPREGYTPAAPFLAFVPMTAQNADQAQGTTWNYDVHAVPKNYSKKQPTKTVKDQEESGELDSAGDTIDYTIDTQTRVIPDGKRLSYYKISDSLDKKNFDIDTAAIVVSIKTRGVLDYTPLTLNDDYKLTLDETHNSFLVDFTVDGLKQLKSNTDVRVSVAVTKKTNDPVAPNQATEYEPSNPNSDYDVEDDTEPSEGTPDGGKKTNTVYTPFGKISFTKVDSKGNALAGAEFKLYQTLPGQTCDRVNVDNIPTTGFEVSAWDAADREVDNVFQSDANGLVDISGLHVNDFANNTDIAIGQQTTYCLIETKAPAGKELLSKAIPFKLLKSETTQDVVVPQMTTTWTQDEDGNVTVDTVEGQTTITVPVYNPFKVTVGDFDGKVVNIDDTTPNLPMTGGVGVGILAVIGAAIIGAGAWLARRGSKA